MAYTNYPSATPRESENPQPQPPKNGGKKWLYGILIALLLGTWAYIIYDHSKSNQEIATLQVQTKTSDSAKNAIQTEYNDALIKMDSLTGSNTNLSGQLAAQKSVIESLKSKIEQIRKEDNGDLTRAKGLIAELNKQVGNLGAQITELKKENATLTANNQQLTTQRDTLISQNKAVTQSLNTTTETNKKLVDEGSTLHASNINIQAIDTKGKKESETTKAKKADLLRVSFTLDENHIASTGTKDLYVIVTDPSGKVISIPSQGSGTFQTREDGQRVYTTLQTINYMQGRRQPVSFDWSLSGARFQPGTYQIEVYNNGYKIGEGSTTLKKTGFLGL